MKYLNQNSSRTKQRAAHEARHKIVEMSEEEAAFQSATKIMLKYMPQKDVIAGMRNMNKAVPTKETETVENE